jgi:drug/metabolite transporter (DMT)-like permease
VIDGELAAGVAAAAVAAVCFNGAVVLYAIESRTVGSEHGLHLSLVRKLLRRPRWIAALALDAVGWPFQLLALSLAPLTVVQPTLSLGLLLLLVLGARRLGERVGPREVAAAAAVMGGVVILAAAAPKHTDQTPDELALGIVLALLVAVSAAPYVLPRRRVGAGLMIVAAGAAFTATALGGKLLTDELNMGHWPIAVVWGVGTAAIAGLGLLSETSALQTAEATRVSPAVFVIQTVAPVIAAPILIGERWGSTPGGGSVLVLGLLLTCAGGVMLSRSRVVVSVAHDEGDQEPRSASSITSSAADGSSASEMSGSRGDASAEPSASASSPGVDATSASPNSR